MIKEKLVKEKPIHIFQGIDYEGMYKVYSDGYITSYKHEKNNGRKLANVVGEHGYSVTSLSICNTNILFRTHRIIATYFCENDDPINKTQVDHIDGNKLNNHYTNLEWVTPHENTLRARKMGLMPMVITEELCHKICDMIWNKGMRNVDISKELGIDRTLIGYISVGKIHRYISETYSNGNWSPNTNLKRLSEEQIHQICDLIWNKGMNDTEISKEMGINYRTIGTISSGKSNRYISDKYSNGNWSPNANKYITVLTVEDIKKVCELRWMKHRTLKEIKEITSFNTSRIEVIIYRARDKDISEPYVKMAYGRLIGTIKRFTRDLRAVNIQMSNYSNKAIAKKMKELYPNVNRQVIDYAVIISKS